MRTFVISDIHAHHDVLIQALNNAGYNPTDEHHHLLVLGDLFDRGSQAEQVLRYLYPLTLEHKATIVVGNHDLFLLEFLEGNLSHAPFNIRHNGFGSTLRSLAGDDSLKMTLEELRTAILRRHPYLPEWLASFPPYLERGDYVFVHGGIDGGKLDWKSMTTIDEFVWNREHELPPLAGKTVVAGHHRTAMIRYKTTNYHLLALHHPDAFDILYEEGKILIDGFVEVSDRINVLILDL
jgi:serine/threonine protein phosphatase 1